ncbi:MAG: translation initiation factor IF-5A [Candidatus Woesearchaeota archaeon]
MAKKLESASNLKVGGYIILDGKACRISDIQISKTGKHGHAKCKIAAVALKDNTKIIKVFPGHDKVEVPIIEKESAQVLSVHEETANVMDNKTYETFDIKIPEEMKDIVKEGETVIYWIIIGERVLRQSK